MTNNFTRIGLLAAAAMLMGTSTAAAFPGGCGYGGYGWGVGGLYRSLDFPTDRRVPYFAAHPPVYYSQPVPRTYGYSPFAYGPDVRTPEVVVAPIEIANPFVPSSKNKPQSADAAGRGLSKRDKTIAAPIKKPAPKPLIIENPFVNSVDSDSVYH